MKVSAARALEAAKVLDLELDKLTQEDVTAAYRAEAKHCHPDAGAYDPAKWHAITAANKALTAYLDQGGAPVAGAAAHAGPVGNCRACAGVGRIKSQTKGFGSGLTMVCVMCNGTGELK